MSVNLVKVLCIKHELMLRTKLRSYKAIDSVKISEGEQKLVSDLRRL